MVEFPFLFKEIPCAGLQLGDDGEQAFFKALPADPAADILYGQRILAA